MRGTRFLCHCKTLRIRITPAYAGNTLAVLHGRGLFGDHPRICGEHSCVAGGGMRVIGSPPHMRGTPQIASSLGERIGITPAYAGNTRANRTTGTDIKDHPRICGEHRLGLTPPTGSTGSPPHMRGTRLGRTIGGDARGITPAYAGNTNLRIFIRLLLWDHPRICGEHSGKMLRS